MSVYVEEREYQYGWGVGRTRRTEGGTVKEDGAVVPLVQLANEAYEPRRDDSVQQRLQTARAIAFQKK